MLINELSKNVGLPIQTLRYYESLGLFEGRTDENVKTNNYKYYDADVVEKVEVIRDAKEVGFTLNEIKKLLETWYGENSSQDDKLKLFTSKISEIDAKINQLKKVKKTLEKVRKEIESGKCN